MGMDQLWKTNMSKNNPDKSDSRPVIVLNGRDSTNQQQLGTLLATISQLTGCLNGANMFRDPAEGTPLDGGVKSSIEGTIIRALTCIDDILGEKTRWKLGEESKAATQTTELLTEQINLTRAHAQLMADENKPHRKYKPALAKVGSGDWIAILGSVDDLHNSIVGVGTSPQSALDAFDALFVGVIPERYFNWLQAVEDSVKRGEKPPSLTQYEQQQQVDQNRNRKTPEASGQGEDPSPDREGTGSDWDFGGPETGPDRSGNTGPGGLGGPS